MIESSANRIVDALDDAALVLDVGGWAKPFSRADWVLDLMPHGTRGQLGSDGAGPERFGTDTWVSRDICDHEPWPFADKQFDFVICSHTLEDVRDPLWVCHELVRVARAGYVEVPSRLEEQSYGVQGPWVGWGHHHWLVDIEPGRIRFTFKHHIMHNRASDHFPQGFHEGLSEEDRVQSFWWKGGFDFAEQFFDSPEQLDAYLAGFVAANLPARRLATAPPARYRRRLGALVRRGRK